MCTTITESCTPTPLRRSTPQHPGDRALFPHTQAHVRYMGLVCAVTLATSATVLGSPLPHRRRLGSHRGGSSRICRGPGLTLAHICTGSGLHASTSALRIGSCVTAIVIHGSALEVGLERKVDNKCVFVTKAPQPPPHGHRTTQGPSSKPDKLHHPSCDCPGKELCLCAKPESCGSTACATAVTMENAPVRS